MPPTQTEDQVRELLARAHEHLRTGRLSDAAALLRDALALVDERMHQELKRVAEATSAATLTPPTDR